jgi:hypothetical protein
LEADADKTVLSRFHILRNPPSHTFLPENRTPYCLDCGIALLDDPTILFLNHVTVPNKLFGAEAQAMWAVAYFDDNIELPLTEQRDRNSVACSLV